VTISVAQVTESLNVLFDFQFQCFCDHAPCPFSGQVIQRAHDFGALPWMASVVPLSMAYPFCSLWTRLECDDPNRIRHFPNSRQSTAFDYTSKPCR
jgi:hypothetical protein